MESALDDCLAQISSKYVLKKERCQAVLGLLGQEDLVAVFFHGIWENFNLTVVRGSETQTKRKERSISCIAIADIINDQVEAMVLIKENRAQVLLTLLLQGKQTLLDLPSACETVKPRSL